MRKLSCRGGSRFGHKRSFLAASQQEERELPGSFPGGGEGTSQQGTSQHAEIEPQEGVQISLGNAFARQHCCRCDMVCSLLRSKRLRAERSLGNAFARLHCCRHDMVCCLLRSKKLRARKQPWTLIGDRQKTRYKSFPYYVRRLDKAKFRCRRPVSAECARLSLDIFFSESSQICVSRFADVRGCFQNSSRIC